MLLDSLMHIRCYISFSVSECKVGMSTEIIVLTDIQECRQICCLLLLHLLGQGLKKDFG